MIEYRSRPSSLSLKYIFRNVALSFEQIAKLCGVSRRQLSYWISKEHVPAPASDPFPTIERAALIRARLEQGDTLRQAALKVEASYEKYGRKMRELQEMSDAERGQQLIKELAALQEQVSGLSLALSEQSTGQIDLPALMVNLRNLALTELSASLPESDPTPDLIIRIQQSASHLRSLREGQFPHKQHESQTT